MTWAYPAQEAVSTTRLGLANGFVATASAFLAGSLIELAVTSAMVGANPWPSALALVLLGAAVVAARFVPRIPRLALLAVVLVWGCAASWLLALALPPAVSAFPLLAASIALTLAGSIAAPRVAAVGTLLGYGACLLGISVAHGVALDVAALVIAIVVAAFYALLGLVRRRSRAAAPRLDSARSADLHAAERQWLELRSRALLHDTVLNELVALGISRPGPLSDSSAASIAASLEVARRATADPAELPLPTVALTRLLDRMRAAGLSVTVSADGSAIDSLPPARRTALLLALEQCLTNVLRHSGANRADLSISLSGDQLVTTIVDEGVGFDEKAIPNDRFGFRESVRGRISQVGGTVRVLSTPGIGTSIIIALPLGDAES